MTRKITIALASLCIAFQLTAFSGPVPPKAPPPLGPESTLTTAGPDEYGYTLSDEGPFSFVDISSYGNTLSFSLLDNGVTALSIRAFDYYTMSDLTTAYISVNGFISFEPIIDIEQSITSKPFPTDSKPNALIAPFWYDLTLESGGGEVYYYLLDDPDPDVACTIIQWNNAKSKIANEFYTFEIILFDNGDIVFAYQPETGSYIGATAGIEDEDGVAGLNYAIPDLIAGETVVITRPGAGIHLMARPQVSPVVFTNGEAWVNVDVTNTTDSALAVDSYNLSMEILESDPDSLSYPWGLTFYDPTCTMVITTIDNLAKDTTTQLCMRVTAGGDQTPGYFARIKVSLTSQADVTRSSSIYIQAAIDSPYSQLYRDGNNGLRLDMNQASGRSSLDVEVPFDGSYMAVNMLSPGHYIIAWLEGSNINYYLYRQYPGVLGPRKSISASPEIPGISPDLSPAVAGSRDGFIGMAYLINLYEGSGTSRTLNSNIYYALLDSNGNMVDGYPVNMTNNSGWLNITFGYPDPGSPIPEYLAPRIVPVGDNKLGIVWRAHYRPLAGLEMDQVQYWVVDTNFSDPLFGYVAELDPDNRPIYPGTTYLEDGRFLISYANYTSANDPLLIKYTVINTDATVSIPPTQINGSSTDQLDVVQLDSGKVLFGWIDNRTSSVNYALLANDLSGVEIPTTPVLYEEFPGHPDYRSAGYPSVTRSSNGNGIITWQDQDWQEQLYYVLIGSDGAYMTPPSLYRRVGSTRPEAQIATNAYGNAPLAGEILLLPAVFRNYVPIRKYFPVIYK
jgi:hypothetical protein